MNKLNLCARLFGKFLHGITYYNKNIITRFHLPNFPPNLKYKWVHIIVILATCLQFILRILARGMIVQTTTKTAFNFATPFHVGFFVCLRLFVRRRRRTDGM